MKCDKRIRVSAVINSLVLLHEYILYLENTLFTFHLTQVSVRVTAGKSSGATEPLIKTILFVKATYFFLNSLSEENI